MKGFNVFVFVLVFFQWLSFCFCTSSSERNALRDKNARMDEANRRCKGKHGEAKSRYLAAAEKQ